MKYPSIKVTVEIWIRLLVNQICEAKVSGWGSSSLILCHKTIHTASNGYLVTLWGPQIPGMSWCSYTPSLSTVQTQGPSSQLNPIIRFQSSAFRVSQNCRAMQNRPLASVNMQISCNVLGRVWVRAAVVCRLAPTTVKRWGVQGGPPSACYGKYRPLLWRTGDRHKQALLSFPLSHVSKPETEKQRPPWR